MMEKQEKIVLEKTSFHMKSPLLRHQPPNGERGVLGYNDSDLLEFV